MQPRLFLMLASLQKFFLVLLVMLPRIRFFLLTAYLWKVKNQYHSFRTALMDAISISQMAEVLLLDGKLV